MKVKLLKPARYDYSEYPEGTELEIDQTTAGLWLEKRICKVSSEKPSAPASAPKAPEASPAQPKTRGRK